MKKIMALTTVALQCIPTVPDLPPLRNLDIIEIELSDKKLDLRVVTQIADILFKEAVKLNNDTPLEYSINLTSESRAEIISQCHPLGYKYEVQLYAFHIQEVELLS